jgi:hypothetical protein
MFDSASVIFSFKDLSSRKYDLELNAESTLSVIKNAVENILDMSLTNQQIYFAGGIIDNDAMTIVEAKLSQEALFI